MCDRYTEDTFLNPLRRQLKGQNQVLQARSQSTDYTSAALSVHRLHLCCALSPQIVLLARSQPTDCSSLDLCSSSNGARTECSAGVHWPQCRQSCCSVNEITSTRYIHSVHDHKYQVYTLSTRLCCFATTMDPNLESQAVPSYSIYCTTSIVFYGIPLHCSCYNTTEC